MQQQLTPHHRMCVENALKWLIRLPGFRKLPGGLEYVEVHDRLRAMLRYGTTDGKPLVESVEPQSVDSTKPGFVMPDNWHWRKVDAINDRGHTVYGVRLIGWDASVHAKHPYFVRCGYEDELWAEHIRFADGDACDWSDDDTVEPC